MLTTSRILAALLFATFFQQSQVTVTVTDATGGRIANALVTLNQNGTQRTATTAADGTATLRDIAPGEWTLTVGMVTSTGVGSIPGYSTRGWSGNDISIMRDGIRQNTGSQSSRPVDTFILDRIEVLKGPASLLYGEGAIGGAVNMISKEPRSSMGIDSLVSFGSFGSYRTGFGLNIPIARNLDARLDSSYSSTDGY